MLSGGRVTDPSTSGPDVPARPALTGRFDTLLGLRLDDRAAFREGLPALTAPLLMSGLYGVCRHPAADVRPIVGRSLDP